MFAGSRYEKHILPILLRYGKYLIMLLLRGKMLRSAAPQQKISGKIRYTDRKNRRA